MIAIIAAIAEFFYHSNRSDHVEIGLKYLMKMWLAATCAVDPLVQPLPQSFFLQKMGGVGRDEVVCCSSLVN